LNKFVRVQEWLKEKGLDAFLITKGVNRYYMSGFTGSNGYLLLTSDNKYLLTDFRYKEQANEQANDCDVIIYKNGLFESLIDVFNKNNLKVIGLDKDDVTLALYEKLNEYVSEVIFVPEEDPCNNLRKVKSAQELKLLKQAVEIADKAYLHIMEYIRPGLTEMEVALELEHFMRKLGGSKNAFETIVASGKRSALPHGVASNKVINYGEFVTMDFGTVYQGYHSDMTRTLVVGESTAHQREIYDIVSKAQMKVIEKIKPGMKVCEADEIARKIIRDAGYGDNFGHGLGHGVGLEIHEQPILSPRNKTILEPGMVVTDEPGIYIPDWGGVRIEDIIIITNEGCEVLNNTPKVLCT